MIHKKILVLVLCTLVLSSLHAGGPQLEYGNPKEALAYYQNGGIVHVFPLGGRYFYGGGKFPKELLEIPTLEYLTISMFDFAIPEEIIKLSNLRKLNIWESSKNLILPKSIAKMKKLKYLSIENANIRNLEQLCTYTQIETLELSHMGLSELPECIGQLMNLKELNLEYNNFKILPNSIVNLVNLKEIHADFNPLERSSFGFEVTEKGSSYKEFWEFYKADAFGFNPPKIIPEAYIVTATSGLSVRNKPKLKAKKIGAMPYKLKIAVYEESAKTETIDGITAPWMRIKAVANGQYMEGWAWGGYLKVYKYEEDYQLRFQDMVNRMAGTNSKLTLDTKQIQFFIKNGADINTENDDGYNGWTLLNIVADIGNIQDFRFLLANGADFQIKSEYGMSVAMSVVRREDIEFESKKAFLLTLQDYGYDFKADAKGILQGAIYSSLGCDLTIEEIEERSSELLDFLKEKLSIERFSEILDDGDYRYFCGL